jgi:hypothetical protein
VLVLVAGCADARHTAPTDTSVRVLSQEMIDPLWNAVQSLAFEGCTEMFTYLSDLYVDGRLSFSDQLLVPGDAQTVFDTWAGQRVDNGQETIQIGSWMAGDPESLVYLLKHEYGHASQWAVDDPNGLNTFESTCQ